MEIDSLSHELNAANVAIAEAGRENKKHTESLISKSKTVFMKEAAEMIEGASRRDALNVMKNIEISEAKMREEIIK